MPEKPRYPSKVIAKYRNTKPKYVYVVYRVSDNGDLDYVGRYWSRQAAKGIARQYAEEYRGVKYVVIREER